MKKTFYLILFLTIIGLSALVAGAMYFGAPAFGWIIMIAIFVVFIFEQVAALKKMKQISCENEIVESCEESRNFNVSGDGIVAKRIEMAKRLLQKKIRLDSPIAFEVLSSTASVSVPRSVGSTVILLGLMGTFFGLMQSVATAGGAIDNSTTQGTLDTIQVLFQNMKGIFGTSLCGLFAALILSSCRSMLVSEREKFMSRLDALTLDMQGDVEVDEESDKSGMERLFDIVGEKLNAVADSVQVGLSGIVAKVGEELSSVTEKMDRNISSSVSSVSDKINESVQAMSKNVNDSVLELSEKMNSSIQKMAGDMTQSVGKLNDSMSNLATNVSSSVTSAFAPMEENVKNLAASVESIPGKLDERFSSLSASLESGLGDIGDGVKASLEGVADGVKAGLEGVADDVKSALSEVSGSVYDGLYKVSESAQNSMADSSNSIAESIADQVKQSNEQWNDFMQRLEERATANVDAQRDGLETLKNVALQVAEKAQAGSAELSQSVSEKLGTLSSDILGAFQKLSETSAVLLEAQKALTESIDNRVVKEKEATDALGGNIVETAELMRVNQSELSANLEMLRSGLETILEKLSGDTAERDEEETFIEHLNQSLEAFHERASEVLMENAVKTQEILLEVLEQTQRSSLGSSTQPKVEG